MNLLQQTDHRPYPLPATPWVMKQVWEDLLFAHWRVPIKTLRKMIPAALELDTFEGEAWLGVVPFRMSGVRPRFVPAMPWLSAFPELNVRTYVRQGDKAGVFFFSLDAANPVGVWLGRNWYNLPYFNSFMVCEPDAEDHSKIRYSCHRVQRGAPPAVFKARYHPTGEVFEAQAGSLEDWLTSRYCLYTINQNDELLRGEIHHLPWQLQPATAEIKVNAMGECHGIRLPDDPPHLLFARYLEVCVWNLVKAN